jgi:hypothetical protein
MSARQKPGPFSTAAEAWFWAMRALTARRNGALVEARAFEPEAVLRALDRLYRQRRLSLDHVRVLRRWGEAGAVPSRNHPARPHWDDAMSALAYALRQAGLVA